jgi:hypothetical protein
VSWSLLLRSLLGVGAPPWRLGEQVWDGTDAWTVRAVLTERGGGRRWPTLRLERGSEIAWVTVDGDQVVRYDPLADVRVGTDGRAIWNGRAYTCTDRGSYIVVGVAGEVSAAVGDRAEYQTLTSADDPERWISVEQWQGGSTEVSAARSWRIARTMPSRATRPPS